MSLKTTIKPKVCNRSKGHPSSPSSSSQPDTLGSQQNQALRASSCLYPSRMHEVSEASPARSQGPRDLVSFIIHFTSHPPALCWVSRGEATSFCKDTCWPLSISRGWWIRRSECPCEVFGIWNVIQLSPSASFTRGPGSSDLELKSLLILKATSLKPNLKAASVTCTYLKNKRQKWY